MGTTPVSYRWHSGAMLRASTSTRSLNPPHDLDLLTETGLAQGRTWLSDVWQHPDVRTALQTASPILCRQISDVLAGDLAEPRRVRRTVLSALSYLLRWSGRPTPFGLFAGVTPLTVGAAPKVSWSDRHKASVRADAEWLSDVIRRLEQCPSLLDRLPVVTDDTGHQRGNWWVAPGQPADGHATLLAPVEVSVAHTRPVAAALTKARTPVRFGALRTSLTEQFPRASPQQIDTVLNGLMAEGLLISSLWAPLTVVDSLGHVCEELQKADAEALPEIADLVRQLHGIHRALTVQGQALPWQQQPEVARRMLALTDVAPAPLVIDTALDCDVAIPRHVVHEAERAVSVLYRLTPTPFGYQHWRDYHRRFRASYGVGAAVPVLDLVADSGLGLPAEYVGSSRRRAPRPVTERDERLLALLQQALMEARDEIVLTDEMVADLALADNDEILPVPRVEVAFEIHARSEEDLAHGDYRLVLTGVPRPGSSMAGRFAHLLPEHEREQLTATYTASDPETICAQLSFAPRRRRNENVVRTPQLLPHVIALGEHREPHQGLIPLSDLAVSADARRLYLVQLSTGKRVEPRILHALEAGTQTPPLARFLAEITTARSAAYKPFDFGAAGKLTYLPRVRHRRTVLSPARWLLTTDDLPARTAPAQVWEAAFVTWRERFHVPDRIAMVEYDQRLPLDLSRPVHRLLLRRHLDTTGRLQLWEAPEPDDLAWIGRAHEVLLPLTLATPSPPTAVPTLRPPRPVQADAAHLPGKATVLHAQLHGHPSRYDELLTEHLPDLIAAFDTRPAWWHRRHRVLAQPDGDQHLAVYLRLPNPEAYGKAAEHLHDWALALRCRGLVSEMVLATYIPQEGRYGHGPAMAAAHAVFTADSAAALAQIRMATASGTAPSALAAASLIDLVTRFFPSPGEGLEWLVRHIDHDHRPVDRALRDSAFQLASRPSALEGRPGDTDVVAAWAKRGAALAAYRERLADQRDPATVVRSLLHMHYVRAIGVNPNGERITNRLARACALRRSAISKSDQ